MTTVQAERMARRKLFLPQLAQELGNISKVCRIRGLQPSAVPRDPAKLRLHGADGLLDRLPWSQGAAPEPRSGVG